MNKKVFILDLDGVIVDTAKYHFLAWKKLAHSIGIDFSLEQNEQLKGVSRIESLEKILSWEEKAISKEQFNALIKKKNEDYLTYINKMDESEILPNVKLLLDFLIENNYKIAIGSGSRNSRKILKKVNLLHYFNTIVDGNDVVNGKPNSEVFLKAANKLNTTPENCVVFEDAVAGIKAANKANMISIGIGDKSILYEADYVFQDFTQITIDFIQKLDRKLV